ncbi:MAG: CopG family transcriptional regulator [Longimicrobiales bacterium]
MRTTLNLDDDVMRAVRALAHERGVSLGDIVSELVRDALRAPPEMARSSGVPVFTVREGAAPITPEMVSEAMEDS